MDRKIYQISQLVNFHFDIENHHIEQLQHIFEDLNIDVIASGANGCIRFNFEIGSWHQLLAILRMVMRRLVEKILALREYADFDRFDQMLIKSNLINIRFSDTNWISIYGLNINNIFIDINSDINKELVLDFSTNYNKKETKKHYICTKYDNFEYSINIGNNNNIGQEATVMLRRLIETFTLIEVSTFEVDWLEL